MKKFKYQIWGIIATLILGVQPAYALTTATSSSETGRQENKQEVKLAQQTANQAQVATNQANRIANAKTRADNEINRRISSLNSLVTKINDIKKLSSTNKTSLTTQVQSQISSLTTLKAKIDVDTDLTTLKADIKSIVDSYRIYLLFIPETHVMLGADAILQAVDKFTAIQTRLTTLISQAQTAGKDVSALNTLMADISAKTTDATTQANAAIAAVANLQPAADTSPYKSAFQTAKADLQTAKKDLEAAREDARKIIQSLHSMNITKSASESGTLNRK